VVSPANPDYATGVRVLYSEGCPGTEIEAVEISSRAFFELGTPGNPTILVNDRDLFPAAAASCCKLYATPEGPKSHPTAGMVRDTLRGIGLGSGS